MCKMIYYPNTSNQKSNKRRSQRFSTLCCVAQTTVISRLQPKPKCCNFKTYTKQFMSCEPNLKLHVSVGWLYWGLTLSQTTNFRLFQTERVCRRQFQM